VRLLECHEWTATVAHLRFFYASGHFRSECCIGAKYGFPHLWRDPIGKRTQTTSFRGAHTSTHRRHRILSWNFKPLHFRVFCPVDCAWTFWWNRTRNQSRRFKSPALFVSFSRITFTDQITLKLIPLPALFRQELCRVARQDYEKEIQRGIELHARIMAERAQSRYRKHYGLCRETLNARGWLRVQDRRVPAAHREVMQPSGGAWCLIRFLHFSL